MSTLQELIKEIEAVNKRAKSEGRSLIGKAFSQFFDLCPEVRCVVWTQYAPYFNDGDRCIFSVHEAEIRPFLDKIEPEIAEQIMESDEGDDEVRYKYGECTVLPRRYSKKSPTPTQERIAKAWSSTIAELFEGHAAESVMEEVFGDDCQVVADRDGFHISEWEHD